MTQAIQTMKKWSTPCCLIVAVCFVLASIAITGNANAALTINSVTLDGGTSVTVAPGATITVVVSETNVGDNWRSTLFRTTDSGGTQINTCINTANHNSDGTYSENFTIPTPAVTGTYDVSVFASSNNGCGGTMSSAFTLTGGIIVATPLSITANPTLCVNDTSIGSQAWTGLTNVGTQNNVYATATASNSQITNFLKCTGYNFTIPAGAIINGITVGPWVNSTYTFTDYAMQLVKTGVIQPTNLASGSNTFPNGTGAMAASPTQLIYGSSTNLWGNTWTTTDINNANFGTAFAAQRGPFATTQTAGVDAMPITVSYTLTTPALPTVITNAASAVTDTGATLNGTVSSNNAITTVTFEYGLTTAYGTTVTATQSPLAAAASSSAVSAAITGLTCGGTLYHFRAKGVNSVGTTNGGDLTFTTTACSPLGGVINTYYPGTVSAPIGATSITLGAASGAATPIAIGDTLLIMQMQDASINITNTDAYGDGSGGDLVGRGTSGVGKSGQYEYAIAGSNVPIGGGTLTLGCSGTTKAYTRAAATATDGQKTFQVVRVPVHPSATLTSTLTASSWNGNTGGVLAFDVTGALTLGSSTVSVDGLGFRGGASRTLTGPGGASLNTDYLTLATVNTNASKGEGIAGTPRYVFTTPSTLTNTAVEGYPNGSHARGAPGNAGGGGTDRNPSTNDQNPGGGGGGNGGAGGIGGIGWCPGFNTTAPYYGCGIAGLASATLNPSGSTGGFGGAAVTGLGATRLTMGGGGGGGTTNNGTGTLAGGLSSSGAAGGGIIMIRAASMTGTATFNANGSAGDDSVRNDGSGGGGAGGVVMVSATSGMAGVTINVRGGKGGNNLMPPGSTATPHGPGGGGGGGYALTSAAPAASSSTSGASGVTYNNGVLFGSYGATSGSPGTTNTSLTAAQIPGTPLGASTCGPTVNHYELSLPTSSITCMPTTATVTACADSSSPCTSPLAAVSGQTATLTASAGTLAASPVTFNASGVATTTLSYPLAVDGATASVTLSAESMAASNPRQCCPDGANCAVADSCSTTFNTAGFIFSSSAGGGIATIPTQVAGTPSGTYYLRAIKTSTTTQACEAALAGANTINLAYECNDPAKCYAADLMSVNGGSATTIARNNNGSVSSYTSVSMTFDANGNAPLTFTYDDVGQVTLYANKTVNSALLTGSSNPFVVKPYDFGIIPCASSVVGACITAPTDPGLVGGGSVFARAGETFKATVTARTASGATTPSFGLGTNNGTETVVLTHNRVAPTGGLTVDGTLIGTTSMFRNSFTDGIATISDLSWNEVGVITLTATNNALLGNALTTTGTSGNIGRFAPDHFIVAVTNTGAFDNTISTNPTFTYLGETFSYTGDAPQFTIYPKALGADDSDPNDRTYNYTGNFNMLDVINDTITLTYPTADNAQLDQTQPPTPAYINLTATEGTHTLTDVGDGTTILTLGGSSQDEFFYDRNLGRVVPFNPNLTISLDTIVETTDTVSASGIPVLVTPSGLSAEQRFGRAVLQNSFGPETQGQAMPLVLEYFDIDLSFAPPINNFLSNAADTLTSFRGELPLGVSDLICSNNIGPIDFADVVVNDLDVRHGETFPLSAPGLGNTGILNYTLTVRSWLQYDWDNIDGLSDGPYDDNPLATATFGIYRGNDRIINWREIVR